jgi:hypothetical protein
MSAAQVTWRPLDSLRRRAIRPTHRVESTRASSRKLQTARNARSSQEAAAVGARRQTLSPSALVREYLHGLDAHTLVRLALPFEHGADR